MVDRFFGDGLRSFGLLDVFVSLSDGSGESDSPFNEEPCCCADADDFLRRVGWCGIELPIQRD